MTLSQRASGDPKVIVVSDPVAAELLETRAAARPFAAVTAAWLLRQTTTLEVREGLRSESAAYSMLLAGPEYAVAGPPRASADGADDLVALRQSGDQLEVRLSRPGRRNAVSAAMRDGLSDVFALAVADPRLQVIPTGDGLEFSAGGDLNEFGTAPDPAIARLISAERNVSWLIHCCRSRVTVRLHVPRPRPASNCPRLRAASSPIPRAGSSCPSWGSAWCRRRAAP
jgi:hypothetical protein